MSTAYPPMPVIVGCPRSGTTLLRLMLDAHPQLAIPPETGFLALPWCDETGRERGREEFFKTITQFPEGAPAWRDFRIPKEVFWQALQTIEPFSIAEGYRMFYRLYAERFDKPRWGDKTPLHCLNLQHISVRLPEAHFIHIIRDGRDVALSLRRMWFSPGPDMETQAAYWQRCVQTAHEQGGRCTHYIELHYEDLLREPERNLRRLCDFLQLEFDAAMLDYHARAPQRLIEHSDRIADNGEILVPHAQRLQQQHKTTEPPDCRRIALWKTSMTQAERYRFENVAGTTLQKFGYAQH